MLSACSGLSSEPEIDHIIPPVPTQTRVTLDQVTDIDLGATIFAEHCVQCHGIRGAGDGQMVQNGQVSMTADFTDPITTQANSLQNWYETITQGRLYALMPPWEDALSVEERWAVAFYTYTLSYTEDSINNGSQLYETRCATCHHESGTSIDTAPSLLGLLGYTDSSLLNKLTTHQAELNLTPQLTSDDLIDITHYLRLLSTSTQSLPDPIAVQPDSTTISGTFGSISGQINIGTSDFTLPDDLTVTLQIYDSQLNVQAREYIVDRDGMYYFEDVVIRDDLAYLISVNHEGWRFASEVVAGDLKQKDRVIDVTLYSSTDDSSVIELTSQTTLINLIPQGLYITETINLRNTSDKMLIRELDNDVIEVASIEIPIPPNAQLLNTVTDTQRFQVNQRGTMLLDTYPAIPNTPHIIQFSYTVPFSDELIFTIPTRYQTRGLQQIYVEYPLLKLQSNEIEYLGNQQIDGLNYSVHQVSVSPDIDHILTYEITKSTIQTVQSHDTIPRNVLAIGLVLIGVLFTLIGSIAILRGNHTPINPTETTQDHIQQIVELDKQFEAGTLDQSTYQNKRDALKAKIADKIKEGSG